MKLYTRSGDDGTTGLFGGERVGKDHPRVEACGTVDELNAWIGLVGSSCDANQPLHAELLGILSEVQARLFEVGADLATPPGTKHESKIARVSAGHVTEIERWIDHIDGGNESMRTFILPGGTELAARLHAARTICRRAERRLVNLGRSMNITPSAGVFLNRLSDLLFAMARRVNKDAGVADVPWTGESKPSQ